MGDSLLVRLASRGYAWYLALKIGQAIVAPVIIAGHVVVVLILTVAMSLFAAGKEFVDCILTIPDYLRGFVMRPWFSGFSRTRYISLYRKSEVIVYRTTEPPK